MAKHGAPDWYKYRPDSFSYPVLDMAELAARLGSISTYERRGDVFLMETFEHGLGRWSVSTSGAGAAVAVNSTIWLSRGYSCKMTAGSDNDRYARLTHHYHFPHIAGIGSEISFTPHADTSYYEGRIIGVFEGVKVQWALKVDNITLKFYFLNALGGWTLLTSLPAQFTDLPMFYTAKLAANLATLKYLRFITGGFTFDLSNTLGYVTPTADANHIEVHFTIVAQAATNPHAYVDNFILTIDEPL